MSISHLKKLKSGIKNLTEVTLNLSLNLIRNYNDDTNFPNKILLTNTKVSKICKTFANGLSANTKFSNNHLPNMIQSGEKLCEFLVALPYAPIKTGTQELIKRAP